MAGWVDEVTQLLATAGGTAVLMRFAGFRFRRDRQKQSEPVCGCEHAFAFHDLRTGECHATVDVPTKYDDYGCARAWKQAPCSCRHYTGPIPLEQVYSTPPTMPRSDN
jgi:hypothetical protein